MSSNPEHQNNTEGDNSFVSTNTVQEPSSQEVDKPSNFMIANESQSETRSFGSEFQKYSKDLIKSLSNFKFTEELTDENYVSWSQAVSEWFRCIDLNVFITKPNHRESALSDAENKKTSFIVTTFILNDLDSNNNLQARNHLTDPSNPHKLVYIPFKCWTYLEDCHAKITEVKL